ncbi:hypothetical protein VIGAN_07161600, partial [Vigna angularis var. angularis]
GIEKRNKQRLWVGSLWVFQFQAHPCFAFSSSSLSFDLSLQGISRHIILLGLVPGVLSCGHEAIGNLVSLRTVAILDAIFTGKILFLHMMLCKDEPFPGFCSNFYFWIENPGF